MVRGVNIVICGLDPLNAAKFTAVININQDKLLRFYSIMGERGTLYTTHFQMHHIYLSI